MLKTFATLTVLALVLSVVVHPAFTALFVGFFFLTVFTVAHRLDNV